MISASSLKSSMYLRPIPTYTRHVLLNKSIWHPSCNSIAFPQLPRGPLTKVSTLHEYVRPVKKGQLSEISRFEF